MTSKTISAENLGPISALEFALESPGVTVLVAPNGSGKTILLEAVQAAARGEGKLPLRDRTRRGKIEAFGATITIGGTCRHTGGFEVTNLEGRFDLAGLVDPRIKDPAKADNARIKALVSLTGVEASPAKFREHEALADSFDRVVKVASTATDDIVEMARLIKADYDGSARAQEDTAERETGHATALVPPKDLNLDEESDSKILQAAYDEARDVVTRLISQSEEATRTNARYDEAVKLLGTLQADEMEAEKLTLTQVIAAHNVQIDLNLKSIDELNRQISELKSRNKQLHDESTTAASKLVAIDRQLALVASAREVLASGGRPVVSEEQLERARDAVLVASQAVERGTLIRQARKDSDKEATHRKAASVARATALKYRDAGKATDEVLSSCIKCPQLRVESDGKAARLVTDSTDRGKSIPYHDLSDGEKWTLAIDIGADQVGAGGLLVISQVGWEGIDGHNRLEIHQHAVNRGVYILTAEASSDPEAAREIVPTPMPHVEPTIEVAKPKATVPVKPPAKPEAAEKPSPKPKAKAAPKPVVPEDLFTEDEDIPF